MPTGYFSTFMGGIAASLIAAFIYQLIVGRDYDLKAKIKVLPLKSGTYNKDFYKYFRKRLRGAKEEIFIVGEGFEIAKIGQESHEKIALEFHNEMKKALERKVRVIRIQTRHPFDRKWADLLRDLLSQYPSNFFLYLLDNDQDEKITSACLIDQKIVEFMFSEERDLGGSKVDLADTAFFIKGSQKLAENARSALTRLKDSKKCVRIKTDQELDKLLNTT